MQHMKQLPSHVKFTMIFDKNIPVKLIDKRKNWKKFDFFWKKINF